MNTRDQERGEQMQVRIKNILTAINSYRAKNLEDVRIESIMTQLEHVQTAIEEDTYFSPGEIRGFDFHLIEDTPFENNQHMAQELYSIKNYVENSL